MEIGIIGLARSGKSTLFKIMTGINKTAAYGEKTMRGVAKVPDKRFDRLVSIFKPAKVSPAAIPFIDINTSEENAWDDIRQSLGSVDGIVHIVDGFSDSNIDEITTLYRKLTDELIFSDLVIVENKITRLGKLQKKLLKPEDLLHMSILPKAKALLESGTPLRELEITENELNSIRGFRFWTIRPELIVLNVAEGDLKLSEKFKEAAHPKSPVISICCQAEMEIADLPQDERSEFLESMDIETPAFEKIIQTSFSLMKRMVYFTVGEDEVKAWVIPQSSTAPKAAAAIHKDFERGFIKAEVVSFDDFIASGETLPSAKSNGKLRLEGKDYIVQDGDIISFRFNV